MYRQAIKYLVLSAVFTRLLSAQNDVLTMKVHLKNTDASASVIKSVKSLDELLKNDSKTERDYIDTRNISDVNSLIPPRTTKTQNRKPEEKAVRSLVSSFRSNIRFGGFWEKHAVIIFSPSVFIKPFDFISIYGNHRTSYFIPIEAVKQEMESLCIQGAAIVAIDNACKFLLGSDGLVPSVANFALKTAVLELLKSTLGNRSSEVSHENSFYYAVSIRF